MTLEKLNNEELKNYDSKTAKNYSRLESLIIAIEKKEIPPEVSFKINPIIMQANTINTKEQNPAQKLQKLKKEVLKILEKETKIVSRKYYQSKWIPLGMIVFGIPIGASFSIALGNWGLMGVGLTPGLAIGAGHGRKLDKKAEKENRVLGVDH